MGFPIPVRCHLYIESGPRSLLWLLMPWFLLHQFICSHGIIVCDKPVLVLNREGFQLPAILVLRNCTKCNYMFSKTNLKLEQLECLHSEDPAPHPSGLMTLITLSHIGCQVKRRQNQIYTFKEFATISNFETNITWDTTSEVVWWDVRIWYGSDEYCWRYTADTILSTHGQTDKVKPVETSLKRGHNNNV